MLFGTFQFHPEFTFAFVLRGGQVQPQFPAVNLCTIPLQQSVLCDLLKGFLALVKREMLRHENTVKIDSSTLNTVRLIML